MSARWDVLGFGIVAVDDLLYVDSYPAPDTKMPIRAKQRQGGGLTGTALVAAARLGAKPAYCGVLGDDDLSHYTVQALEREGVDCTQILCRPDARPYHSIVIVDRSTGQRTILFSAQGVVSRSPEEMTDQLISRCRVLFVDYMAGDGGVRAVQLAQARGIPVVGDIERETAPGAMELIRQVDHLIVGIDTAGRVTGETLPDSMVRALASDYVIKGGKRTCCAVTAGERGCWYAESGGWVSHVPAYRVAVVDTTGCGDVFHGAYAACIARGESVATAIRVATAAAALKATRPGGREGIPDRRTVDRFIVERGAHRSI